MRILPETCENKARMAAAVAREDMEEGEVSSGSEEGGGDKGWGEGLINSTNTKNLAYRRH